MAKEKKYADPSRRILAVTAADRLLFQDSFSTVYRLLRRDGLTTARGAWRGHSGLSNPLGRKDLTCPDQRLCWGISYLMTHQKVQYLYRYLLPGEWSRKTIQWRIAWALTAEESR